MKWNIAKENDTGRLTSCYLIHDQWGRNGFYLWEDRKNFFICGRIRSNFFQMLILFSIKKNFLSQNLREDWSSDPPWFALTVHDSKIMHYIGRLIFMRSLSMIDRARRPEWNVFEIQCIQFNELAMYFLYLHRQISREITCIKEEKNDYIDI